MVKPVLELLEERRMLTIFAVDSLADVAQLNPGTNDPTDENGNISLRSAIGAANVDAANGVADTIVFDSGLSGQTITLTLGTLSLVGFSSGDTDTITIDASALAGGLTISGDNLVDVFTVEAEVTALLRALTIVEGYGAGGSGGVIGGCGIVNGGFLSVEQCTISDSTAEGFGGGIFNFGTITITDSTIADNVALGGGGGGIYNEGIATITRSTLSGNVAQEYDSGFGLAGGNGGGIYNSGSLFLVNSTLANNTAQNGLGGGLYNNAGGSVLVNSTTSGNIAADAGGIYSFTGLTLLNSIVAGNSSSGVDLMHLDGSFNAGNSLVGSANNHAALDNSNFVQPNYLGVGVLGDYGGLTQTVPLLPGSPAINAGDDDAAVDDQLNPLATDQRGETRIFGAAVDIGAFEVQTSAAVTIDDRPRLANGPDGQFQVGRYDATGALDVTVAIANATAPGYTLAAGSGIVPGSFDFDDGTGILTFTFAVGASVAVVNVEGVNPTHEAVAATYSLDAALQSVSGSGVAGIYVIDANNASTEVAIGGNGLVVTNTNVTGDGSLKQAILNNNALYRPGTITFASGLAGTIALSDTLTLRNARSSVANPLAIDGSAASNLIIRSDAADIFTVDQRVTAVVRGLQVEVNSDGRFENRGSLTVEDTSFDITAGNRLTLDTTFPNPQVIFKGTTDFNVATGASVDIVEATMSGVVTGSGPGAVDLLGTIIIGLGGLTLDLPGNLLQWTSGVVDADLGDLINLGTMTLAGPGLKNIIKEGTLDNFGTILHTGTGALAFDTSNQLAHGLRNESGAFYLFQNDADIIGTGTTPGSPYPFIENAGTIRKEGGAGTAALRVLGSVTNTGTIEAVSGTLQLDPDAISNLSANTLTGGTWKATGGATLQFPVGSAITSNAADITLSGAGSTIVGIASLATNSGSLSLTSGANLSTSGNFANSGTLTMGVDSTLNVAGDFTQTADGTFNEQIGGAPASGDFGQTAVTGTANLAGRFNLALVDDFGPTAGQTFSVISYAQAVNNFDLFTGLHPFFTPSVTANSLDLTNAAINAVDLALTTVTAPTAAIVGDSITVNWQVTNQSAQAATGNWQDRVWLSTGPTLQNSSLYSLGSVLRTGGLAAGNFYNGTLSATLPTWFGIGPSYIIVQSDSLYHVADPDRTDNELASIAGAIDIDVPSLTLGTPLSDSFSNSVDRYYRVDVPAGGALEIELDSDALSGSTALYVSRGTLPTRFRFDFAATEHQPDQNILVPRIVTAGTYYLLVRGVRGNAITSNFSITATQTNDLTIRSVPVSSGGNAGNVTIQIDGTNFSPTIAASLTLGGTTINSSAVEFVNESQIFATFDLTGAAVGSYVLAVQQGAQSAQAPTPFVVASATAATAQISVTLPADIRAGRTGTMTISYANRSSNDIAAPVLQILSTNPDVFFSTPDDPNLFTRYAQLIALAPEGPAGILRPGQRGELTLSVLSNDTLDGNVIPIEVHQLQRGVTIDWAFRKEENQPDDVADEAWDVTWNNLLSIVGSTTDSYVAALADAATYLHSIGESATRYGNIGALWSFLLSQAGNAFPHATLDSTVDAALRTPGSLPLVVDRTYAATLGGRYKSGMFGAGWTTSLDSKLTTDVAGNVYLVAGGGLRVFTKQANGTFLSTSADFGRLTFASGKYAYTSIAGYKSSYLANGSLDYLEDPNHNRITYGYNGSNQLVSLSYSNTSLVTQPDLQLTLSYNAQGFVSSVDDGLGRVTTYDYDAEGRLIAVTAPGPVGDLVTSYTYDTGANLATRNALLTITHPDSVRANFGYDPGTGRLVSQSTSSVANPGQLSNARTISYPGQAKIVTTDSDGANKVVWFNSAGQAARVQSPTAAVTNYSYDANGNLVQVVDASGRVFRYEYDNRGNLIRSVDSTGETVRHSYDVRGNLTAIVKAGQITRYTYDSAGNNIAIIYPDGSQRTFSAIDTFGNVGVDTLQNGSSIRYEFDAQGRISRQTLADDSYKVFTYDAHGNVTAAEAFGASGVSTDLTTQTYNDVGQLTTVEYADGRSLTFTYDAQGRRATNTDQDGYTLTYAYDDLGRLEELSDGLGMTVQYVYNDLGQLGEIVRGNGSSTTYAYDAEGILTEVVNLAPDSSVNSSFEYTYNSLQQKTSMTDAEGFVTSYGYSSNGRLTSVVVTDSGGFEVSSTTYGYDVLGNRTFVDTDGANVAYSSNLSNEITQVGSASYLYDPNGNLRSVTNSNGTTIYDFSDTNQLQSITSADGNVTTYQYDPFGRLVGQTVDGVQTKYLYDPSGSGSLAAAYDSADQLIAHYNQGTLLASQTGPTGVGYYDFDGVSNTVGITDATGDYVNQYQYQPFGETTTVAAELPNPFTYVGAHGVAQFNSELFWMRARTYSPTTGQFLSNDPSGIAGGDINLRSYAMNAPTNGIDPMGLNPLPPPPTMPAQFLTDLARSTLVQPWLDGLAHQATYMATQAAAEASAVANAGSILWEGATTLSAGEFLATLGLSAGTAVTAALAVGITAGTAINIGLNLAIPQQVDQFQAALASAMLKASGQRDTAALVSADQSTLQADARLIRQRAESKRNLNNSSKVDVVDWGLTSFLKDGNFRNRTSDDPNAVTGPNGFGAEKFIQPQGDWPYTVEFENIGSIAALDVTVTQQLDSDLDWTTFQLGSFGFGAVNVFVPPNLTHFEDTVSYQNLDGTTLNVAVTLDFNVDTGQLTIGLISLDPLTGIAPNDVFAGFLYPEDGSGNGQGFMRYTVQPLANLPTGTQIEAQASIVFDINDAILTNTFINTIDAGAPASSVNALAATQTTTSFTVGWGGTDDSGGPTGSGIATFDIYVSDNNGAYTLWKDDTSLASDSFTGIDGHTYRFYSVATDNVGHEEQKAPVAEATTQVVTDTTPPTSSVTALPAFTSAATFGVSWSGSDNVGGTGLASFDIFVSDDNGPYTLWQDDVTTTSANYAGAHGHTYRFYSVAKDVTGNEEAAPASADAVTTVDTVAPGSSVATLPTYTTTASFSVNWSGSDNSGGSGVATFDIFVSDNNGGYALWKDDTALTSSTYPGVDGHSYRFYSVAKDVAGNEEAAPTSADATALVDTTNPSSQIANLPAFSPANFNVSWSGSDSPGGSGLASFDIFAGTTDDQDLGLLLDNTTATSTIYSGTNGTTYVFVSQATDNAGNLQQISSANNRTTTVDAAPPASSVATLPATIATATFSVSWSGNDGAGSGVSFFDVFVSDNNGPFTLWKDNVTGTTGNYSGIDGHTYGFYSVATDGVGNVEAAPSGADATTQIVLPSATLDFGDAPDPRWFIPGRYPTLLANDGPRHTVGGLFLGGSINGEADGQPNAHANADASDDGVIMAANLFAGVSAAAKVNASAAGKLDAWIDFDRDGRFEDDEQVARRYNVVAGDNLLPFDVPDCPFTGTTFARFRLSSAGGLAPTGAAPDGEVEDYSVEIRNVGSGSALLRQDPANPDRNALILAGTYRGDKITVERTGSQLRAKLGSKTLGTFPTALVDRIVAVGGYGDDTIEVKSGINIATEMRGNDGRDRLFGGPLNDRIWGGPGNDWLDGRGGDDLFWGEAGDDQIWGGDGRDFAIGGAGKDTINGGGGDDLLIAGTTCYDQNLATLKQITDEWNSSRDYNQRVANLRTGAGPILLNTGIRLESDFSVFDDGVRDTLKGNADLDWFFYRLGEDKLYDQMSAEETN